VGGDQLKPGVEDGGIPTEVVAEKNKKILKTRKQENEQTKTDGRGALGPGYPITTNHSRKPPVEVGGDQLQPGVEDGGTPTEVVAKTKTKNKKKERENKKIQTKEGPEYPGEGAAKTSAAGPF
jgi:hypothetical protein